MDGGGVKKIKKPGKKRANDLKYKVGEKKEGQGVREHTARPSGVDVGARVLPAMEMALHVSVIVVIDGGRDEGGIIDAVMPAALVVIVQPLPPADHDAPVRTRIQPIVPAAAEAHVVRVGQVWRRRRLSPPLLGGDGDVRAEGLDGDDGAAVLREEAGRVGVGGEDDVFGVDGATRGEGGGAVVVVQVHGFDGGIGLQVEGFFFHESAEKLGHEFVGPKGENRGAHGGLGVFDRGYLWIFKGNAFG
jgi:hypothetical protein